MFGPIQLAVRDADQLRMTQAWDVPPPTREAVETWLDQIRPALLADGGNVELLGVDPDGTVRITLQGACADCPAQLATLRLGIEQPLRKAFAGVQSVVAVDA
jgi:Fe-S cluster biogenesis protein NfuA